MAYSQIVNGFEVEVHNVRFFVNSLIPETPAGDPAYLDADQRVRVDPRWLMSHPDVVTTTLARFVPPSPLVRVAVGLARGRLKGFSPPLDVGMDATMVDFPLCLHGTERYTQKTIRIVDGDFESTPRYVVGVACLGQLLEQHMLSDSSGRDVEARVLALADTPLARHLVSIDQVAVDGEDLEITFSPAGMEGQFIKRLRATGPGGAYPGVRRSSDPILCTRVARFSTAALLKLHGAIQECDLEDRSRTPGSYTYGTRVFSDFRRQADAIEEELRLRDTVFTPIDWTPLG